MYASETWTLTAEILEKLEATEMRCFRTLLGISFIKHITNDAVRDKIRHAIGPYDDILTTVKKRKLRWFGHVSCIIRACQDNLTKNSSARRERIGGQRKRWENSIFGWTGLKFCDALI